MVRYISFIIGAVLLPLFVFAYTSPGKPVGFVNDFAKILNASSTASLENKLISLEKSTGAQVSVVTVSTLGDETVDTYASKLFTEWGIGQKGKDNGLLILVAPNDRKARIEVGYGLEGDITDLQAGNIVRGVMIPAFKSGDFTLGINGAVDAVSGIISGTIDGSQFSGSSNNGKSTTDDSIAILFIIIILINVLSRILGATKSWWLGGVLGAIIGVFIGFFAGFVPVGIVAIIILVPLGLAFDYFVSNRKPPRSGSGRGGVGFWPLFWGGSGFGGGSGGGFGGFGGGGSGGGGASGGW